jgi:membrane protease YdiL (CAAX protease family)
MSKLPQILSLALFPVTAIVLIAFQFKFAGFLLLDLGLLMLFFCSTSFRRDFILLYFCLWLLGITPINTSTDFPHALYMGITLFLVVFVPYIVSKKMYKNYLIRFPFHHGRSWRTTEILYILITAGIAYLLLPIMLRNTGSYHNWIIKPGLYNLAKSYVGLNAVGIWDELFFVSTVLAILRAHIRFAWANLIQAVIFTSFLYTLGFQGWSFIVIFLFALTQGYIFKRTESLLYILTIHLTFDLILHLTLVYLHYPSWLPFFIT